MSLTIAQCETIDEVIDQLECIISYCSSRHHKLGYFASLYRNVTLRVKQEISKGRFEDGPRMERLDVIFANLYLKALDEYWRGRATRASWEVAFKAARRRSPIIFQHLLMGMNAHINLDLAVAAVQTAPGPELAGLKRDFYEITDLLQEMIDEVQERIDRVSPWLHLIDRLGGRTDEQICSFAIGAAREMAWGTAERLAALTAGELEAAIAEHDQKVARLGLAIASPGVPLNLGMWLVRARERHPVAKVIEALRLD